MAFSQQDAYNRYQNGVTAATEDKSQLSDPRVLSQQFVTFMRDFHTVYTPESVDTGSLGVTRYSKLVFFESLMSHTFHVHWGNYYPPVQNPSGNTLMVQFRQTENGYKLRYVGFDRVLEYDFEPDYFVLNSNSLEFTDGLVGVNIKRLSSKTHNGENLWVHEFMSNGRLTRYYLLPYDISE